MEGVTTKNYDREGRGVMRSQTKERKQEMIKTLGHREKWRRTKVEDLLSWRHTTHERSREILINPPLPQEEEG